MRRDGAILRAVRLQLRDAQLHIGIRQAQQIERHRRVGDQMAARSPAWRRRRRSRRGGGWRSGLGITPPTAASRSILSEAHAACTDGRPSCPSRRGAFHRQTRAQRLQAQDRSARCRRLGTRQQRGGSATVPAQGRGRIVEAALASDLHRLIGLRRRHIQLVDLQPRHGPAQVRRADMQRHAGDRWQRRAGVGHPRRQADIVQRRQSLPWHERRQRRQIRHVRGQLDRIAPRLLAAGDACRRARASRRPPPSAACTGHAR